MIVDGLELRSITIDLKHDVINEFLSEASMSEEEVCLADFIDFKTCLFLCCLVPQSECSTIFRKRS